MNDGWSYNVPLMISFYERAEVPSDLNGLNWMEKKCEKCHSESSFYLWLFHMRKQKKGSLKCSWLWNSFYQSKADAGAAYKNCISDVNVSIVSLIKSQVIHLTWRLLDQCSTCSGLIPAYKMAVLIRIGGGSPSGWSKDRERCGREKGCLGYWEAVGAGAASSSLMLVEELGFGSRGRVVWLSVSHTG